jgi:4-hydroxythreonine-4-phosphate dehydrogenase
VNIRPVIGITMGDAAGVGPEVVAKALLNTELAGACLPLVIGDARVMAKAMQLTGNRAELNPIHDLSGLKHEPDCLNILDLHNLTELEWVAGQISPACGKASVEYIIQAARLALHNDINALVTAPINIIRKPPVWPATANWVIWNYWPITPVLKNMPPCWPVKT